jgi:hypothetical protein
LRSGGDRRSVRNGWEVLRWGKVGGHSEAPRTVGSGLLWRPGQDAVENVLEGSSRGRSRFEDGSTG